MLTAFLFITNCSKNTLQLLKNLSQFYKWHNYYKCGTVTNLFCNLSLTGQNQELYIVCISFFTKKA